MIHSEYDIVIVGAGSSGVSAAISASDSGNSVLLIEKSNRLGGMATKNEVGTICGLYLNDTSKNFKYNVNDFTENFAKSIQKLSKSSPIRNSSELKFLPYSISEFESYCEDVLKENKVQTLKNAALVKVDKNENGIDSIQIDVDSSFANIKVKTIIDASGVNVVSQLVGDCLKPISFEQTKTHVFTLSEIDFVSEQNLAFILLLKTKGHFDISIVPGSFSKNRVSLKLNFSNLIEGESAQQKIDKVFLFLTSTIKGFSESELLSIADETGERIGRRAEGKYTLTENDVLSCRKFKDSVANGNWPIEQWYLEEGLVIKEIKSNDFYQIPKQCLQSKHFSNLFYAGRNISADENAIASARVIGACLQTGFASGELAKEFVKNLK